jgi:predicted Zn-dependent protease
MLRPRPGLLGLTVAVAVVAAPPASHAQVGSSIRGKVVDSNGQPLADVNVEFVYKGESRVKIVKTTKTDKKGGWVRVGLQSGNWAITFTKAGYEPHSMETWTGGDALSELPTVTLAAAATGQATPTSAAEVEAAAKQKERDKALGQTYNSAVEAMKAGDTAKAETLFRQVLAEKPGLAPAHHNLGFLAMQKKDLATAEAEFRQAIETGPMISDSYLALAALLGEVGKSPAAFEVLNGAAINFPLDARFQFVLGVVASNAGKDAEALAAFQKVAELDPANVETQYYLGTLAVATDVPKAIGYLEAYVAAAPETSPNRATATALLAALKKKK